MRKTRLHIFLFVFLLGIIMPIIPVYAAGGSCNNSCSQISGECIGTRALQGSASAKMDINCLKTNSASSCFNQVPITGGTGNYNSIGKRSATRNHYGTDIGASNTTSAKALAAAEGEVIYARSAGGSGWTIAINHKKKCQGGGGYHTVYRHLYKMFVSAGQHVNANEPIGIVGGSNTVNGKVCHNPAQLKNCASGWYAIHLHFELLDGELCGSCSTQATPSKVMSPYCKDAAVLCGGCPDSQECKCTKNCGGAFGDSSNRQAPGESSGGTAAGEVSSNTNAADVDAYSSKNCSFGEFLDSKSCVFCNLFKIMYNSASDIALNANNRLAAPSKSLVIIGFLIWMAIYFLKQIGTFNATSTGEMLKGLLFQGFRVAVVVIILSNAIPQVMNLTLNPVMQTGFNFVQNLSAFSVCDDSLDYMQNIKGFEDSYSAENADGGLPKNVGKAIICSMKNLEDATGTLMALGDYSICLAHTKHTIKGVIPSLGYLSTGWFLWIVGAILLMAFPWCLIDCVLQLCIAAALVPCAIAAFAFKITEKYIKIIWSFFMNAMFNFVFMALIVYIINSHLKDWIGLSKLSQAELDEHEDIFISGGIIDMLGGQFEGLAWWGIGAIKLLAMCFFCWTFFDEAAAMAKKFADSPGLGGSKGIGRMVGGTMAQMGTNWGLKPAAHYTKKGAQALGRGINSAVGNSFRSGVNHGKGWAMDKLAKLGIAQSQITKDPNTGKTIGYKSKIRLFGRDIERNVTRDENGNWSLEKTTHKRSAIDKAFEVARDENGNIIRDENGIPQYLSRQRVLGKVIGYEAMTATRDKNGNLHYATADGSRSFTMDNDGKILSYKTPYTGTLLGGSHEKTDRHQYGTTKTINDGISKTVQKFDANGNLVSSDTEFKNVSASHLMNTDGTLNANSFNQIKNGAKDPEIAASYMVEEVMKSRGIGLPETFADRKVNLNKDGSFTIVQKNLVGHDKISNKDLYETRVVNTQIIGNQMVIDITAVDSRGNLTHHKSNGIQTIVDKFTLQYDSKGNIMKDKDGKSLYKYSSSPQFSEYWQKRNSGHGVIATDGSWGNLVDRDKAMAGFTQQDFDKHLAKIKLKELRRTNTLNKFNKELNTKGSQINVLNGLLSKESLSQAEVMALNAGLMSTIGIPLDELPFGASSEDLLSPLNDTRDKNNLPYTDKPNDEDKPANPQEDERKRQEESKAKADEDERKRQEESKAKADEDKLKREAEKEKNQRLKEEHEVHEVERAQLAKERDKITQQFAEVEKQLTAAKAAVDAVGLTPQEKQQAEAAYNALLRQSNALRETLARNRKANNDAINDYNSRADKHNSELGDKKKLQ